MRLLRALPHAARAEVRVHWRQLVRGCLYALPSCAALHLLPPSSPRGAARMISCV